MLTSACSLTKGVSLATTGAPAAGGSGGNGSARATEHAREPIPDLKNLTEEQANDALQKAGFRKPLRIRPYHQDGRCLDDLLDTSIEVGTICRQRPIAGQMYSTNLPVAAWLQLRRDRGGNDGTGWSEWVRMPDFSGHSGEAAAANLARLGFRADRIHIAQDSHAACSPGTVCKTVPKPHTRAAFKAHVYLYVGAAEESIGNAPDTSGDDTYTRAKDPAGLDAIPRRARELGEPIAKTLRSAKEQKRDMERWHTDARRFSESSGKWSYVRSRLHREADEIKNHWMKKWQESEKACTPLATTKDHPDVERALATLGTFVHNQDALIQTLVADLTKLAGLLRRVRDAKSESDINAAKQLSRGVADGLKKLQYAKGKHGRANQIADKWPRHVGDLDASLSALATLKKYQFTLDTAAKRCQEADRKLRDFVAQNRSKPGGLERIPAFADKLAEPVAKALNNADSHRSKVERLRSDSKRLSASDGPWREIKSNLHAAADRIFDYWIRALAQAHRSCDDMVRGQTSRIVIDLMKSTESTGRAAENRAMDAKRAAGAACKAALQAADARDRVATEYEAVLVKVDKEEAGWLEQLGAMAALEKTLEQAQRRLKTELDGCQEKMKIWMEADTAWEAVYGR